MGPLGLLIPKMPESGRADVEAEAAVEVVTERIALRTGPIADDAAPTEATMVSAEDCKLCSAGCVAVDST